MQDLVFQFEHRLRLAQLVFLLFLLGHVRQRGEEDGAVLLAAQEEGAHAHPHDLAVQSVPTKGGFGSRDGALVRFGEHALYEGQIVGELDPKQTTVQELGLYMSGAKRDDMGGDQA